MTNLIHLQNILNKVIDEARDSTLEGFVHYLNDQGNNALTQDDIQTHLTDFKKTQNTPVLNFGPKKKEKKTRPPNSYNMFIKDKMHEIKLANPEFKGKELMKRATEAWNLQKQAALALATNDSSEA